ncbi:MAG: RNase P subunit p30 family protein [Candidatus Hodarchaeales archaeon]|jgi:RNase P/RNase MRP subunit p30
MPRNFVDSLSPRHSQLPACLHTANQLGFVEIWISNPIKKERQLMTQSSFTSLIRIYERLDIGFNNESKAQIVSILRQRRRKIPIIAVTCLTPELTAWAAQDNRVDILKFPVFKMGKLMSRSIAKLMIKFQKHLEIPLSELYSLPERQQIPALRQIRSALRIATRKNVPIIFNSGSNTVDQMRTPLELASLGQVLLSTSTPSLDSLSIIPQRLLQQNLLKISPNYITPGVYKIPFPQSSEMVETEEE